MSSILNFTKVDIETTTHLVLALLCLPLYQFGGEVFKYLLAPYVLYLLFSLQPRFLPALLIHFMDGTTMSFLILLGCLIISIKNIKKLKYYKVRVLFILALIPLPFFLYTLYLKITLYDQSIVMLANFLFMYLGLFSFFYFLLIARKFKTTHLKYIFIVLGFAIVLHLFSLTTVRYIFFSLPVFVSLLFISLIKKNVLHKLFLWSFAMVLIIFILGVTSTLVFTSLLGTLIAFYYFKKKVLSKRITHVLFGATLLIVLISILNYNPLTQKSSNYNVADEKLDVFDPTSIYERARFKLFEDRAPIWFSIYDNFVRNGEYAIPVEQSSYVYYSIKGSKLESDIPAHNIYLELIKQYGIITGLILSLVFVIMIIKSSLILKIKNLNTYLIVISSCIISCGFFGGMTGQYLLLGTFSFLFMGLAGLCYGIYRNNENYQAINNYNSGN
jgi:hypothetical protein